MAYAAMTTVTVALVAAWTASYFSNASLVTAMEARAAAADRELRSLRELRPGDEARLLVVLNALRELQLQREVPLVQRIGLYQGAKLGAQAERAYRNALRESLVPHLALSLEKALRSGASREVLDAYLALHGTPDSARVEQAALRVWRLPEAARNDLSAHLRAALAEQPLALPRPRDDALVEQARRKLGAGARA
jgi:type VI secretion system protein ImpL